MTPFGPSGRRQRSSKASLARGRGAARGGADGGEPFFLYVEGPSDRDILRIWARRLSPHLARSLDPCAVILGGRRPARAVEHFRRLGGAAAGIRGLVVLDRDHHAEDEAVLEEPGLELFTWGRRHIESYLLVRSALARCAAERAEAKLAERLVADHVPAADDEQAHRTLNAKHLLGSKGPLARGLGATLAPGDIARCMRSEELHADVLRLYERIRAGLGLKESELEVVRRSRE
jgi:hypothetical protein